MPQPVAELDRLFQALSDPTRRAVVERLGRGPAATTELARPFDMALPSFLQHLDVLEKAGIVSSQKQGRVRTFRLVPGALAQVEAWAAERERASRQRFDRLEPFLAATEDGGRDGTA